MFFVLLLLSSTSTYAHEIELITKWPWNRDHPAGMTARLTMGSDSFDGTCTFHLPEPVSVFHINKGFVVPSESDFADNLYTFTFPDGAELEILVLFHRMSEYGFNIEHIQIHCQDHSAWQLGLYSFPNSLDTQSARSALRHVDNFRNVTSINLVFPSKVKNFKITDERITVTPNRASSSIYQLNNLDIINFHEIWFEVSGLHLKCTDKMNDSV